MTNPKLKIGILFGGIAEEHPISLKSVQEVARNLDPTKYEPFYLAITKAGAWRLCDSPAGDWETNRSRPAILSPDTDTHGLLILGQGWYESIRLDVILPVLHGRTGEDGAIQGLLELSGIPYVGCDVQSSALCLDKSLTYLVARNAGIPTPEFRIVTGNAAPTSDLTYPLFVKPARSGSSFGVSKVTTPADLPAALELARQYDSKILIEESVPASEVGCAILGTGTDLVAGDVDRIALTHGFFRIHQEDSPETGSENSTFVVPADIPPATATRVQETAKTIYRALGCRGLARVDMFLKDDGEIVLNEVNTLPGLTSYSRYPRMMASAGLPFSEVLDRLIALALNENGDHR